MKVSQGILFLLFGILCLFIEQTKHIAYFIIGFSFTRIDDNIIIFEKK